MKKFTIVAATILLIFSQLFSNYHNAFAGSGGDVKISSYSEQSAPATLPTRLIVRTQNRGWWGLMGKPSNTVLAQSMETTPSVDAKFVREMGDFQIFDMGKTLTQAEYNQVASALAQVDGVTAVEPDIFITTEDTIPNDPYFAVNPSSSQYQYSMRGDGILFNNPSLHTYGINAPGAWDITQGDPNLRIAVLDTGMISHPDLDGRWIGGYDFVSDPNYSGDNDGWDADPTDTSNTAPFLSSSRWHGSHVAGTIAARANNNYGVAGLNWNSMVVPVRVLGWAGGWFSDAMIGLEWGAGLPVTGVPNNPYPAKVFNMSLGGQSASCPEYIQTSIDKVYNLGGIIVVAGGNSKMDVSGQSPANCNHVIAVAAAKTIMTLDLDTSYSNFGDKVTITAPGSEVYSTTYSSTSNTDLNPQITGKNGTSMASPNAAGVVSLMLSVRPELSFDNIVSILKSSARAFPAGSWCATNVGKCGGGFLDAFQAVLSAVNFITPTATPTNTLAPSNTPTNTSVPTNTPTATATHTNVPTNTPTNTSVPTNTPTATATHTNVPTNTPTATATHTNVPTNTPTITAIPPTATPTYTVTNTPTNTLVPSATATATFTKTATPTNTLTPSTTPIPPSATKTATYTLVPPSASPTFTNTPVPPTATNTPAPTATFTPTSAPLLSISPSSVDLNVGEELVVNGVNFGDNPKLTIEIINSTNESTVKQLDYEISGNAVHIQLTANSLPNGSYKVRVKWDTSEWSLTSQVFTVTGSVSTHAVFIPLVVR